MTDLSFPLKNIPYTFFVSLISQANAKLFSVNPTITAGDVKVSVNGGTFSNITTLPVVTPTGSKAVKVDLSAAEMNGDFILVLFSDVAGGEWCDTMVEIRPSDMPLSNKVWESASRTLTQVITPAEAATMVNNTLTIRKGDHVSISITGLGNISTRTKLWFTAKLDQKQTDQFATIQIEESAGLTILNGATHTTTTDGSIVVDNAVLGNITIIMKPVITAAIGLYRKVYDIQMLTSTGVVTTLTGGILNITPDVTHTIS